MEKKVYTKEFKLGAVRMVVDEEMKAARVCKDLGISTSALTRWVSDYRKHGKGAFPGKGNLAAEDAKYESLSASVVGCARSGTF